ncbi:MAG: GNAT family N-acetyltransferase [Gammaproteobacteria bacterium]
MHVTIKQPKTAEEFNNYYHLRWKLLRAPWNQPEGSEIDDIEDQCFHVMAVTYNEAIHNQSIDNEKVIGVARLQFNSDSEAQIRYMAVEPSHERQGIGRRLLEALEVQAKTVSCQKVILDAREPAINFYQKFGFKIIEKSYLLFDEIQHFRMEKDI